MKKTKLFKILKIKIEVIKKMLSERTLERENGVNEQELDIEASPADYKKWKGKYSGIEDKLKEKKT